ncbi:MAG: prepilin-type N-terminal cleavage/methylation domain-containing protein [Planctomycetota bacterium]
MRIRPNSSFFPVITGRRSGYTLIEILVATTLTLILMTAVVTVFGGVGDGIAKSRRALEQFDRLRTAAQQLRVDLQGVTVTMDGRPTRPEENQGYFEVIKGSDAGTDPTAIGRGNILMFTTRNAARPFAGRFNSVCIQSDVAEVAWFVRGNTLHRRVLLVVPGAASTMALANPDKGTFYAKNDISAHIADGKIVPNSLADLTKNENRFAHAASAPFTSGWGSLGLPTLNECSSGWMAGWVSGSTPPPAGGGGGGVTDLWDSASIQTGPLKEDALVTGTPPPTPATRIADDVVLNNVIGFEVKIWPAAAGSYADQEYDSGCFGYENEGRTTKSPTAPLRGIQIKIRCFEPGSRQIREIPIEQDFLPK